MAMMARSDGKGERPVTFECFTYGSNMLEAKMARAAPTATFRAVGCVMGYVLRFNKAVSRRFREGEHRGDGCAD